MRVRAGIAAAVAPLVGLLLACGPPPAGQPPPSSPPPPPAGVFTSTWRQIGTGSAETVSGLAPAPSGWLIVRDNKGGTQNRVSMLSSSGGVTPLAWPGTPPVDLESLASIPGLPGQWATLTAQGSGTIFSLSGTSVVIQRTFAVPAGTSGIEGFALTRVGTTTIAVWATRGSPTAPAKVRAAAFDPSTGAFGAVSTGELTVPYPTANVRHVSDLALVGTRLVASSASDPGADGPFDSALYRIGTVGLSGGRAVLTLTAPQSLGTFSGHKVEALACSGTTGLLATDDENQGSSARTASFCTP